jgi:hypothetical protein
MSGDAIGNDVRKLRRERRLGRGACCVLCGTKDLPALRKISRTHLQEHHVVGKANDDRLVVVVCLNCHADLSEAQRDSGVQLRSRDDRTSLERLEAVLRGLADFLFLLAAALVRWADELAAQTRRLDAAFPSWRDRGAGDSQ